VWFLADIEVSSAKTEVCDLKIILKNQQMSYNYKTSDVISINQLNYKALEKYYATKELDGYSKTSGITVSVSVYNCSLRLILGIASFLRHI
jgi:hypothetical protein